MNCGEISTMTDEPLKPCPFCGGIDIYESIAVLEYYGPEYRVNCKNCNGMAGTLDSDTAAAKSWNTRPEPASAWHPIETLDRTRTDDVLLRDSTGLAGVFAANNFDSDHWTHWCEVPK